jgi:hypothetical protein
LQRSIMDEAGMGSGTLINLRAWIH